MTDPITPPVSQEVIDSIDVAAQVMASDPGALGTVKGDLTLLQRFAAKDKSAVVAALLHITVLLVAALGLHLNADQLATLGTIETAGLSYFITKQL